jgi:hypothetical protein
MARITLTFLLVLSCSKAPPTCSVVAESGDDAACEAGEVCAWEGTGRTWACLVDCEADADCPDEQTCTLLIPTCPACDDSEDYCDWAS